MSVITTIDDGVAYLNKRGFKALRREWAMGTSLFAFAGESKVNGVVLSDVGLYIYSKDKQWLVVQGQGQETGFSELETAVLFLEGKLVTARRGCS